MGGMRRGGTLLFGILLLWGATGSSCSGETCSAGCGGTAVCIPVETIVFEELTGNAGPCNRGVLPETETTSCARALTSVCSSTGDEGALQLAEGCLFSAPGACDGGNGLRQSWEACAEGDAGFSSACSAAFKTQIDLATGCDAGMLSDGGCVP
jgi:hypothetical protein